MATVMAMMRIVTITVTTAPMMAALLSVELPGLFDSVVGCSHFPSSKDEIATWQSESTFSDAPLTEILDPPLTHSSIREMSELLFVSAVPSSLARNVVCAGDSGEQTSDCSSMIPLLHSVHDGISMSTIAIVTSSIEDFYVNEIGWQLGIPGHMSMHANYQALLYTTTLLSMRVVISRWSHAVFGSRLSMHMRMRV